jgi:serine/threonine protein kinase
MIILVSVVVDYGVFQIGQGTYSNVFKAKEIETGKIVALKKVSCRDLGSYIE